MRWLLRLFVGDADRRTIEADLAELYEYRRRLVGDRAAARWLRRQRVLYPFLLLAARLRGAMAVTSYADDLLRDLRYTIRTLGRAPHFAITAILVVALGVGANTAAFSVADFVLIRPLPFPDSDALVRLCEGPREGGGWGCMNELSPANYRDFKSMTSSFQGLGAFAREAVNLVGGGEPQRLTSARLTPDVLRVLGVSPVVGRAFDDAGADLRTVVISYGLWQSQFGGDRSILGRPATLSGIAHTVIGVMPRGFYFPDRDVHLWTVLDLREVDYGDRGNTYLQAVGRLQQGVTFEEARADLEVVVDRLARDHPETNEETGVSFFRMRDEMSPRSRLMLIALGGASLCLLLLTCANLANLLLVRAAARERELTLRAALGAGRLRLTRQVLTETVVLSLAGGAAGVALAAAAIPLFSSLVPSTLPLATQPELDLRVLGFAALCTALTGVGFGLVPAVRASFQAAGEALRAGGRTIGARAQRGRAVLVSVEVMMSVVLLVSSGLLLRAVWRVQAIDAGFAPQNVLTLRTALPRPKYDNPARRGDFYNRVLDGVRALPGVERAAFTSGLPMVVTGLITGVEIPGREPQNRRTAGVSHRWITPQYFESLGIPLRRGRDVADRDTADRQWVAVVSQSFTERYWPGQDPIGKTFLHGGRERTIVGEVGDVKVRGLERVSEPQLYVPALQTPDGFPDVFDPRDLVIRHAGAPDALAASVREIIRAADPEQPLSDVRTMEDVLAGDTASRRAQLQVLGVFAVVAVLLSGVGIHGLLAYTVSQRAREMGVRLALGAQPARLGRMVLGQGIRLALFGVLPGLLGAYLAGRAMSAMLFGVSPADPVTLVVAAGVAFSTAIAGTIVPALRAVRMSPTSALATE